jgi:hypothetical protein
MNIKTKTNHSLSFYLLIIGIFLIVISPAFLSDGMFMDGLIYSALSNNLAKGLGTFWNPHLSSIFMSEFHEHPPLAFGIQSIFYNIFGDSRYIEKIYSFMTFVIVGFIIVKIWKHLNLKNAWIPLFVWILMPLNSWACPNNMLENTMSIFISLSVFFFLKTQQKLPVLFLFLSGFAIFLGALTKGFVAFFPWTLPFISWLILRHKKFVKMVFESFGLIIFSLIPLIIIILFWPEAKLSLQKYFNVQVIKSLQNVKTVDSRLYIVGTLFLELLPSIGICTIIIFWAWRKKLPIGITKEIYKPALVFFLLGLCGVLPIMVSMKQRSFYILATLPYFAIAIAMLINPLIDKLLTKQAEKFKKYNYFRWISVFVISVGIFMSLFFAAKIGRDKNEIEDTYTIIQKIPEGGIINILPETYTEFSLHGYYARYKNISLDPDLTQKREFFLVNIGLLSDSSILTGYHKLDLQTKEYQLFQKIE